MDYGEDAKYGTMASAGSPCTQFRLAWHRLMPGDTLFSLAQEYGTTVECIQHLNPWAVPTASPVNCWIVVGAQSPTSVNCRDFELIWYRVRSGDTLFELAAVFGTTIECLAFWHPWIDPNNLPIGCWVVGSVRQSSPTPTPTEPPACTRFRVCWDQIGAGDTLFTIAQRNNSTVECLQRLNSWADPANLPVGCWMALRVQSPSSENCRDFELTWCQLRPGDTLVGLAERLGIPMECLTFWHPWVNSGNLPIGCWIIGGIRESEPSPTPVPYPCEIRLSWHRLSSGNTFYQLARRYDTTVQCLQRLNSWANPLNLPAGCWIVIGASSPTTSDCHAFNLRWYQLRSGDTLAAIAQRFGTTTECLTVWNPWAVRTNLPAGCWVVVGRQ